MDLHPLDWVAGPVTFSNRRQLGRVGLDNAVATHAGAGRRHVGVLGLGDVVMAETAIQVQPVLACVPSVVERHRLLRLVSDAQILGRGVIGHCRCYDCGQEKDTDDDLDRGEVGTACEYIGHE